MPGPSEQSPAVGTLPQSVRRDFSAVGYDEAMRRAREIVPILRERAQACRGRAHAGPRERAAAARDRPLPLPPAEGLRGHGARLRGGGRHSRGDRARLPVDGVERRQPRLPSLDPRLLRSRDPARGVGRQPGRADRLLDRARRRPRAQGRRAGSSSAAAGRSLPASTIPTGTCLPSPSTATTARRRSTGGCAWCPSPTTRSSTPGTRWAWRPRAARTSRSPSCSCPERRALALQRCRGGSEHPGAALTPGPLYRIPIVAASSHPLAPAAVGAAEGAYEMFVASMAKRAGTYTGATRGGLPGGADQGGSRSLPDRCRAHAPAPVGHRVPGERRAQRGAGPRDQAALPRATPPSP